MSLRGSLSGTAHFGVITRDLWLSPGGSNIPRLFLLQMMLKLSPTHGNVGSESRQTGVFVRFKLLVAEPRTNGVQRVLWSLGSFSQQLPLYRINF